MFWEMSMWAVLNQRDKNMDVLACNGIHATCHAIEADQISTCVKLA